MYSSQVCSTDMFGNTVCKDSFPSSSFYSPYSSPISPYYGSPLGGTTVTTTHVGPSPGLMWFGWNWYSWIFSIVFFVIIVIVIVVAVVFGKSSSSSVSSSDLSALEIYPDEINRFTLTEQSSTFSPDLIETNFINPLNGGSKIQVHLSNKPAGPININKISFRWIKVNQKDPQLGEIGVRQFLFCDYGLPGYLSRHPDGYLYLSPVLPEEKRAVKLARVNGSFTFVDSQRQVIRYKSYPGMIYAGSAEMKTIGFDSGNNPVLFRLDR